jgi:hypothetical protein
LFRWYKKSCRLNITRCCFCFSHIAEKCKQ